MGTAEKVVPFLIPQVENKIKALPHNSSAALAMPFLPSASCRNLDLPPVNLRFLQSHLTKNAFAIAPTHLCGIALTKSSLAAPRIVQYGSTKGRKENRERKRTAPRYQEWRESNGKSIRALLRDKRSQENHRMIEQPHGNTRSVCCQRQTLFYKRFEKTRMRQCLPMK